MQISLSQSELTKLKPTPSYGNQLDQFDSLEQEVLQTIEKNFLKVCKRVLTSRHQCTLKNTEGFDEQLIKYQFALVNHLKYISTELYTYCRINLPDGDDKELVAELEQATLHQNSRISDILKKFPTSDTLDLQSRNNALSALNRSVENHFLREKKVLFPIYSKIA